MSSVESGPLPQSSPFWTFSLGYYRGAGVSEACLELQDKCGVDVNVVLFLLWLASQKRRLGADQVKRLAPVYGLVILAVLLALLFSILLPETFPTMINLRSIIGDKAIIAILSLAVMIPMIRKLMSGVN